MQHDRVIGHRGAAAYAPENTLASFKKARALGCRFVEFDVMCSLDGEPFVFHDEVLKRTTNGRGDFHLTTAEALKQLDAGRWFSKAFQDERIPHFKDLIEWLVEADMSANVEIKAGLNQVEETSTAVLSCIQRYWPSKKDLPLISSFNWAVLDFCRNIAPELPLGLLLHDWDEHYLKKAKELACYSIHFNRKILNEERVRAAKAEGYQVFAYTVNRKRLARKLLSYGVDAVFSDYPDLLA